VQWLQQLPPMTFYAVIGGLAALENVFPPVPADTAVAVGAVLSVGGRLTVWGVFVTTWVANVGGAALVYAGARTVGRGFFRGRIGRRLLKREQLARLERLYVRHGVWAIFLSRFVPGLRALVAPFAGVANLGWVRTLMPVMLASALWYGALTFVAATTIRNLGQIAHVIAAVNRGFLVFTLLAVVTAIVWWLLRRRARREHE
jgi:membrane protein DedA with SNARE-associated domain